MPLIEMPQNFISLTYPFPYKTLDASDDFNGNFTDGTFSGNVTVGGTLGVTGNSTIGGTLGVTGNSTIGGSLGVTGNIVGNNMINSMTTTTLTANNTTVTLTNASDGQQLFLETGAGNYTGCVVLLPDVTTLLTPGQAYFINNNCTTTSVAVQTSTAIAIVTVSAGASIVFTVISSASNATTSWDWHALLAAGSTWSTAALATSSIINASNGFNGTIGAVTPNTGKFTTVQSTIATGTAPFTVASTTQVTNLNANSLQGGSWNSPGAIGIFSAAAGNFTTIGVTTQGSGKFTTAQLTTNMATAGVLLNDTSGNITSSLGALAVAKGGTGVTASYGTGSTVALPPTGGIAGQPLVSGAGAGSAMTWGQRGINTKVQTTTTACAASTLTTLLYDNVINNNLSDGNLTYSAGIYTWGGAASISVLVSASVGFNTAGLGSAYIYIHPSGAGQPQITGSGYIAGAGQLVATASGLVRMAQNDTFKIEAYQNTALSCNSNTGSGANCTFVSVSFYT